MKPAALPVPTAPRMPPVGAARYRTRSRRELPRWMSVTAIVALHGAALAALLQVDAVRATVAEAAPLFVEFITPPQPKPVEVPPPPQPKPVVQKQPPRIIASPKPSPSPMTAPPVDAAPVTAPPAPVAPPAEPVAAAPSPAPAPIVPPRFTGAGLDNPAAEYPLTSRRLKESGRVVLRVLVNPAGTADRVELQSSSGYERLDESALAAVRRWHFLPARQGDTPVAQWVNVSIPFELTRS